MTILEFENFGPEKTPEKPVSGDQKYIDYSIKVLAYLEAKVKNHNDDEDKKYVKISQLKNVFANAAKNFCEAETFEFKIHEWSIARINMFLGIKAGGKINYSKKDVVKVKDFLDVSSIIIPSEANIIQAKEDIKSYDLDLDFKSINNLYIEEEGDTVQFIWE
jgi:hypothetical protein